MKRSAGCLLYRLRPDGLEVLLVRPSGPWSRARLEPDDPDSLFAAVGGGKAPWGIPKGEIDPNESPEDAARRETLEETGVAAGELLDLGQIDYTRSRKRVFCFTGIAAESCEPRCASWEVDRAVFVPIARARQLIHADQAAFLDRLEASLGGR